MKKLVCLLLIILSSLSLFACGNSAPTFSVDFPLPWQSSAAVNAYEKSVFTVEKVDVTTNQVIGEGVLTYIVDFDHKDENNISYSQLTSTFEMTYNDNAPEQDRGLTDYVMSKTVFLSTALTPTRTIKAVQLAPRAGEEANLSYSLETDYVGGVSKMTLNGVDSEINFAKKNLSGVYDNEMLYYVVRSYPKLNELSSYLTFKLANFVDMHLENAYKTYTMQIAPDVEQAEQTVYLPGLKGRFGLGDEGAVTATNISVSINSTLSGPPIDLLYSKTPFVVGEGLTTKRALVGISTYEYDISESELKYQTNYTLSDYSVTP